MSDDQEHVRAHIELAIERARDGVGERIDAIEDRLRGQLDFQKMASDHAPQLVAAGAAFGFLLGFGVPKVLFRTIQIAFPILLAVKVAQNRSEHAIEDHFA